MSAGTPITALAQITQIENVILGHSSCPINTNLNRAFLHDKNHKIPILPYKNCPI